MRRIVLQCLFLLCCLSTFALSATRAQAATYTVTNTSDATTDGTCSAATTGDGCTLREAITASNTAKGNNAIVFAPSLNGTISLLKALPDLAANVTITGPGALDLTVQRTASAADFTVFVVDANVTATLEGLTITNGTGNADDKNFAGFGGGVANLGNLTVNRCIVTGNTATLGGGIVSGGQSDTNPTLVVNDSAVTNNTATSECGGLSIFYGTGTVTNSTVSGNTADGGLGGGMESYGPLTVQNCAVYDNNADAGAGILIYEFTGDEDDASLTMSNSTVSNNIADTQAGGIANVGGVMTIEQCTLSGNDSGQNSSGIGNFNLDTNAKATISGTIIDLNTFDDDVNGDGTYISKGYNIIGGGATADTAVFSKTGDQVGVTNDDLLLGPLQDNGGLTQTMALGEGSVAIDAGNPDAADLPEFDQRGKGFPRVFGDSVDVGAFEAQAEPVTDQLTVTGKAYNAVALATLSGINVTAIRMGNVSPAGQATTDGTGTYTLNLLPGTYRFIAKKATDTNFRIAPDFTNPATLTEANTTNANYNFRAIGIGGRVISPFNIGVNNVTLTLYAGSSTTATSTQTTDSNGFFSFDGLAAGTWRVVPTAPTNLDYTPLSRTLVVANKPVFTSFKAAARVEYSFSGRATINNNGTVQGVSGVTITAMRASDNVAFTTTTTSTGTYTLSGLTAGSYTVTATLASSGYAYVYNPSPAQPQPLSLTANAPKRMGINFLARPYVMGRVYNAVALEGLAGFTIKGVRTSDNATFTTKSDSTGNYILPVDAGKYTLSASLPNDPNYPIATTFTNPVTVATTASTTNYNFRSVGIGGRVTTISNVGVSGVTLKLYSQKDTGLKTVLRTVTTDKNGFFSFDAIVPGTWNVVPTATSTSTTSTNYTPASRLVTVSNTAVFTSFQQYNVTK